MSEERRQDYMKRELVDYMMSSQSDRALGVMQFLRPGIVFEKFGAEGAKKLDDMLSKDIGIIEEGKAWEKLVYGHKMDERAIDRIIGSYDDKLRNSAARDMTLWIAERFGDYELCMKMYPALAVLSWGEVMLYNIGQIKRINANDKDVEHSLGVMQARLEKHIAKLKEERE